MREHRGRVLQVLDRLQEHDRIGRLGESLDKIASEAQVLARVAQARVLVRLGVGVHAHDRRGATGEHIRAVALAAGHVDRAQPGHSRGDPLVHGQVAAEPVVLLGHVRQRALASERERRHALGLVALQEEWRRAGAEGHGHGARVYVPRVCTRQSRIVCAGALLCRAVTPLINAEEIRDVNTRYHDVAADHYDAKWGIDFGDVGQAQVTSKVRKALGGEPTRFERSLEIGSGTGYFTLNLMRAGLIGKRPAPTSLPECWPR